MKKTLVAIAALASVTAFAQVTITGIVDAGYRARSSSDDATLKFGKIQANNTATTAFFFAGNEDLGGGLSAGFHAELNWNPTSSQATNNNVSSQQFYVGTPFNGEQFIRIESKDAGKLRIGTPNSAILEANGQAQPFGTAIGGGYMNTGVNRLGSAALSTLGINQYVGGVEAVGRVIRYDRSVRYDTPVINGFSASYTFAGKNGNQTATTTSAGDNNNGITEMGIKYNNGPLNAAYATTTATAGTNAAASGISLVTTASGTGTPAAATYTTALNTATAGLGAGQTVKYTYGAANYKIGAATLYTGMTTGVTGGGLTTMNASSKNVAIKYEVTGNINLMANYLTVDDKTSSNFDAKLLGFGADYMLSKRTIAYFRQEKGDTKTNTAAAGGYTTSAVGLRHSF